MTNGMFFTFHQYIMYCCVSILKTDIVLKIHTFTSYYRHTITVTTRNFLIHRYVMLSNVKYKLFRLGRHTILNRKWVSSSPSALSDKFHPRSKMHARIQLRLDIMLLLLL